MEGRIFFCPNSGEQALHRPSLATLRPVNQFWVEKLRGCQNSFKHQGLFWKIRPQLYRLWYDFSCSNEFFLLGAAMRGMSKAEAYLVTLATRTPKILKQMASM